MSVYVCGLSCDVVRAFGVPAGKLGVLEVTLFKLTGQNKFFLTVEENTMRCDPDYLKYHPYERYFTKCCLFTPMGIDGQIDGIIKTGKALELYASRRAKNPKYFSDSEARELNWFAQVWGLTA